MAITLFQSASNDQSRVFLGKIFGDVGGLLPSTNTGLISHLFKVFNTTVLSVAALVIIYITVVGLLNTAQQGEFLGNRWAKLWVPIRTVFGIAALFPISGGYSAIQIIFMWVILQGVGAADSLWRSSLSFIDSYGVGSSVIEGGSSSSPQIIYEKILQGAMCQATAMRNFGDITTTGGKTISFYCNKNPSADFCAPSYNASNIPSDGNYKMAGGKCGVLQVAGQCNEATPQCDLNKSQRQVVSTGLGTLATFTSQIAQMDGQYISYYIFGYMMPMPPWLDLYCQRKGISPNNCCGQAPRTPFASNYQCQLPNYFDNNTFPNAKPELFKLYIEAYTYQLPGVDANTLASDEVIKTFRLAYDDVIKNTLERASTDRPVAELSDVLRQAESVGWIYAGAFYYDLAKSDNANAAQSPKFVFVEPGNTLVPLGQNIRANYQMFGSDSSSSISEITSDITNRGMFDAANKFLANLRADDTGNPLRNLANFGHKLMVKCYEMYAIAVAGIGALAGLASINPMGIGTGLTLPPWAEAVKAVFLIFLPFFVILLSALFSIGAILSVYIPLIPYILFTAGAIGWLVTTVEAMAAAPLVALGILSPGGQHEVLGKAEPALMLLFNLFLRPTLMIFGLMAAFLASFITIKFMNYGFLRVMLVVGFKEDPIQQMVFMAAYAAFMAVFMNKTFSLIYIIPERILVWIGGQPVSYGEQEALGATKQATEGSASAISGAGRQSAGNVEGGVAGLKRANKAKKEEDEKGRQGGGVAPDE